MKKPTIFFAVCAWLSSCQSTSKVECENKPIVAMEYRNDLAESDYKMRLLLPDTSIHYKILRIEPDTSLHYYILNAGPFPKALSPGPHPNEDAFKNPGAK